MPHFRKLVPIQLRGVSFRTIEKGRFRLTGAVSVRLKGVEWQPNLILIDPDFSHSEGARQFA